MGMKEAGRKFWRQWLGARREVQLHHTPAAVPYNRNDRVLQRRHWASAVISINSAGPTHPSPPALGAAPAAPGARRLSPQAGPMLLLGASALQSRQPLPRGLLGRPSGLLGAAPRLGSCRRQQQRSVVLAAAEPRRGASEADLYVAAEPPAPPPPKTTRVPFYVYAPLGLLALLGVMRAIGAAMRRRYGAGGGASKAAGRHSWTARSQRLAQPHACSQ